MYIQGDTIPNVGIVEYNHCGFPWPLGLGGEFCGTVQISKGILSESVFCDAISGKILSDEEFEARKNNYIYDYEKKSRNCIEWREKNRVRIIKGQIRWHKYEKDLTLIGYIRCLKAIIKAKLRRNK